ncbi:MAG: WecB/TagA/CpsF family glycosyltransferase [Lachnospiraceae bacterium]|nr:WecB/TagA/CpsF family glycosyltransferase [Lachnospiraceae bacterium]
MSEDLRSKITEDGMDKCSEVKRLRRAFYVCNSVGICPMTRQEFVKELFDLPTKPVSATVDLVGMPAVVSSKSDQKYADMYNRATMAVIDGMPLVRKARHRGYKCERCSGPDMMGMVFEEGIKRGATHYFYGGKNDEVLLKIKENLERDYPGINIAGMYSPPFRPLTEEEDIQVCEEINKLNPTFVWVGIGAPKQEMWMQEHADKLDGVIMLGVGAAFDFIAGSLEKAPSWIEKAGFEWLFRLIKEPRRLWKRYIIGGFKYLGYSIRAPFEKNKHKRFKVAMIGHKRIPSREGGVEIVVEEISKRLIDLDYDVDAYNRSGYHVSGKEFEQTHGRHAKRFGHIRIITVPTFQNGKLNAIVYTVLATIRALFGHYDVLHYHAEGPCAMLWLPKLFGKRIVATIHGLDWQRAKWGNFASKVLKDGEKMAVKHADEIIVLSKNVQQYFKDTYGRDTHFIPNGINRPKKVPIDLTAKKYGIEANEYFLFLARLVPEKGVHYLIEAFKEIKTDKKLVIAGGGSYSKEYMSKIHELAEGDDRIIFTNFIQGRMLEELYSNAYMFVLPSDVEGMALSLLEAMSYGNCCVVSDIPENTEVVEDKAVVFKKGDVDNLKTKLEELLNDEKLADKYRADAADFICKKYNWDDVVKETVKLYRRDA